MAASMSIEQSGMDGRMMLNPGTGIAFDIEISECVTSGSPVPKRVRRRLVETMESKSKYPASLEGIESRLKEADLRRQQFHEWLANKARSRPRTSPRSPQYEDLAQRLEAKLSAAEQKRAELLAQEQMRLAKLHELRVAAKTEAQLRSEREREELGCKVELRVLQAENKRLALLEAEKQRHAAAHERIAQSVMHRTHQEGKDRERIEALRVAICKRIAAAEEKRAGLLRAEKNRAQASVLQARLVAKAVVRERELELRKKKEKLEDRLQRARRQRAEFLRQRGGCRGVCHNQGHKLHKHGDRLCRKLTRCWRQFRRSRRTTYSLAQDYVACAINVESVTSIAFEQLAARITSPLTLRTVKALLGRIESRLVLSLAGHATKAAQIDHLLKHLSPPSRRTGASVASASGKKLTPQGGYKGVAKDAGRSPAGTAAVSTGKDVPTSEEKDKDRYPARVFLCAYMIQGQPDAVFSSQGKRETALAAAAARLLPEFEALTTTILNGPSTTPLCPSSPNSAAEKSSDWSPDGPASTPVQPPQFRPFAAQLAAFDSAWCSYLYQFVAWKVKDAQVLEADLTRMACQLELSMLQKCKVLPNGNPSELSHDAKAIRKQVFEDQNLLRDRIVHLTGSAGLVRLENALVDTRVKFEDAIRNGLPLPSPFASPVLSKSYSTMPNLPVSASPGGNSQESHNEAVQLLATENDNCNNEGQLCVEPQSAEKAANHSVGPSIPQLLERTIPAEDQCRITAALEGNAITVHEGKFVRSTVGCLGRENMSPATQAPFTQASQELVETPKGVEGEEDARDMQTSSSRLVMQETQPDAGVAATGLLRKKKKEGKVKKRTVSLSEGEKQLEYLVEETEDVLVKAGSKKSKGFQFHTISKLQKKTEGIPANNIFKHEDETVILVKVEGKNELQIERNLELNNDNGASESTTHFSAQSKKKSDLSPAGSVSITAIQGKVKEKRKKKRALDVAEVKTMGETTLEGTLAVREVEPDTSVGGNVSVALNGDKLKEERRKKKFVELESSCVNDNQVRLGGEKVSELSADRQSEQEKAHKGHISGKRKVKVSKLHRSPTSGSLDAEAATNLQFSTSNATQNNMAMNVNTEGNNVPDLRTVRKKGRRKQSMTDVLGVNGMTSMIIGFPEPGTVQAEGETAGENVQCTSQAHVAHALKERSREDGDKVSGSQQRGKEGEVMLTNDGSSVKDTGAGSDNREVAVLVGLPQAKAETLFEQAKDGFLQALDSLPGTPWPSAPVLVTKQGRGAPSGISTHEGTFDMMEEVTAARRETGFQNKRYRSGKHDNEAQSLEREEATQTVVLRLAFETQADEQVDGLVLGNEGTLQNGNKSRKDSHSSKSSEGGEFRSDIALVKKTQVGALDGKARESRVSQTSFPIGNGKAFQKQEVNIIENSPVERGEENTEKDSAQPLSQDTSYKVAATQVSNALSGSTTEETGEEIGLIWSKGTETQPHEQKVDALNSQLKDFIGLSHSAGENGNPDTILSAPAPSKAARTPLPIVPRIRASGIAENIRRRSLGAAAEIESKFAQFIDSQDGLDEIMDITFSQRKIRSADLSDQVASAGAIELPEAASSRPGNGVLENGGESMPPLSDVPITLEKHKSAALLQVPGKSLVSLPTVEFKVPKAVLPSTTAGAENANHNSGGPTHNSGRSMLSSDVEVPIGFGSSTNLPKDVQENSGENQKFFAFEVQSMDADVTGSESLQLDWKNQSSSALQGTIEADTKKRSEAIVEKRRRLSKRKEDGLEFMVVNNTERLVTDEMERKDSGEKRVDVESPATFLEFSGQQGDDDSKTNFWRTCANREEDNQSQDTSLVSGRRPGKKRRQSKVKREETEVGLNESELLVNNTVSSVDRATCEEDPKVAVTNSRATDGDGLGHVIRGSDTMEMPDDEVKTTIEHGNVERESGQCEQVKGPTLLNQEKVQSDLNLSEFDSEDGDTLVSRIVKSGKKSGKRQAEHMEEICERAVSRVLEDEMLHVADPDFVLQKKSRKDTNPTSWTSKKKGSNVSETMEGVKLEPIQSTVTTKKASKSSKSGGTILKKMVAHKPVTDSGSEVCPMGCGKIYKGKTSAWYVHKSKCLGAPAD